MVWCQGGAKPPAAAASLKFAVRRSRASAQGGRGGFVAVCVDCMAKGGTPIAKAAMTANLAAKRSHPLFRSDLSPLLAPGATFDVDQALDQVLAELVAQFCEIPCPKRSRPRAAMLPKTVEELERPHSVRSDTISHDAEPRTTSRLARMTHLATLEYHCGRLGLLAPRQRCRRASRNGRSDRI